ncbi:phage tail length tape measure family protein [Pseudotabrizicola alkalilacus]|uniref:Bacteriophage tail tape measure N-terminal domain-containing protein n=1 Tax=Pseudotabrizicola alkalilacus TaxID=2305252 RepID=A0A411Z1J8_9RHOB|nr:phage tail length tape measure family protein [Pseudotabrizicola alkalilacus]RGP36937.1 hypothetical protein D1012_12360 [Pseudotabrizicola alkalilacus]
MTTQTHSLALKIDAEAAKAGSRVFVAAVTAVKKAVHDLDRQADGTFAKLANHRPQFDVSPLTRATTEAQKLGTAISGAGNASDRAAQMIQRTALASASAVRMAEQATQRLALRMDDLGDTQGLASLNNALAQMKASLLGATSTLDVRKSKSGFDDVRSSLLQTTVASERLRGEQAQLAREMLETNRASTSQAASLESLRSKYDSVFATSRQYATALSEIQTLEDAGAVSAQRAAQMRDRAAQSILAAGGANDRFAASARTSGHETAYLAAQFNDIGVMMAAGQNPFILALQQGTQVSQMLNQMGGKTAILRGLASGFMSMINPVSLITIGVIAAGAAIVQWMTSGSEATKSFADSLSDAESKISTITRSTATLAGAKLGSLAEGYGRVNAELKIHLERLGQIAQLEALSANRNTIQALEDEVTGGWITSDIDDVRIALNTTNDGARIFLGLLKQVKEARTFQEQTDAISKARKWLESTGTTLDRAEGSALNLLMGLIKSEDAALKLLHASEESASAIAGAVNQTAAWANMMAAVKMQIDAIGSSLAAIGGGAISAASKRVEIEALSRGESLRGAEIARIRHDNELKLGARTQAANARGGIAGWAESQLINMERFALEENIRLDDQLSAQREAARKRETSTKKSGGGRVEALGDESRQLSKISKQLNDRIFGLNRENAALNLLIEGKARTKEGAEAMAMALELNKGKLDAATEATIRAYEANVLLNEQLQRDAKDPFREYIQGLPSVMESTKQLKLEMAQVLEGGINDLFMGEFDTKKLVDGLRRSLAQMLAQRSMKMLFGNMFDSSGIEMASASGARQMQSGIVMGAQQGAQMFAAALSGAAIPAGGGGGMGGGFGLIGGLFSLFGFAEGGYSDRPGMSVHHVSPAAFRNAPHYKEGTSNTSGIPAVLHPNEAVVPLTKGRKIPVDASGLEEAAPGAAPHFTMGDVHVEIKTEKSIEDPATAAQAAKNVAEMIKQQVSMQMAEAAQYGGLMNPRGT